MNLDDREAKCASATSLVSKPALPPPTVADVAIIDGASRVELLWRSIGLLSLSGGSTLIRYERLLQTVRLLLTRGWDADECIRNLNELSALTKKILGLIQQELDS